MEKLSENTLVKIWRYQLLEKERLATEDGQPVKIIYPGRINNGQGADFRDAVIEIGGKLLKGDVEIHVRSGDWRNHHHHLDKTYNSVVLHVVMIHNSRTATILENGTEVPVLAIPECVNLPAGWLTDLESYPAASGTPCFGCVRRHGIRFVSEVLDKAGERRFFIKAGRFQSEILETGADQSLYRGIMGALGYSGNKLALLELARRVPLKVLEAGTGLNTPENEYLAIRQALLLGTAGFLSGQYRDSYRVPGLDSRWTERLESLWVSSPRTRVMSPDSWHLFKIRPGNSPSCRLMAMSYLLLRYRDEGLLGGLIGLVEDLPAGAGCRELERGLLVTEHDYEECCPRYCGRIRRRALLGKERAADIVVNVVLPFVFAFGRVTGRPEIGEKALCLYRSYRRLGVNSIERHMTGQLGLTRSMVNSAVRQQGLIHIYNSLCTQGKCGGCGLGKFESGNHVQSQTVRAAGPEAEITAGGNHGGVIRT